MNQEDTKPTIDLLPMSRLAPQTMIGQPETVRAVSLEEEIDGVRPRLWRLLRSAAAGARAVRHLQLDLQLDPERHGRLPQSDQPN